MGYIGCRLLTFTKPIQYKKYVVQLNWNNNFGSMLISVIMYRTLFVVNIKNKFLRYNLKLISTAFEFKSSIKLAYIMSRLD